MKLVVTFDGPVACGKSSLARLVARQVDYVLLSTGLLYRAIAYMATRVGLESFADNEATMLQVVKSSYYTFDIVDRESRLLVNGNDITDELKNDELSLLASRVSKHEKVRCALLQVQRKLDRDKGIIVEGRDTGRVVFPDAHLKYWLTADIHFRIKMRQCDLMDAGKRVSFREVYYQIQARDRQDMEGDNPSLVRTSDMKHIDTTYQSLDSLAFTIADLIRELETQFNGGDKNE